MYNLNFQDQIKSFIMLPVLYTPKRVTSLSFPSPPHHCAWVKQLRSKKCCSGGEPLATLSSIRPVRDLNFTPPAPGTNALPLDQLACLKILR